MMAVRIPHKNRGRSFELVIEYANAYYAAKGVALVQKVATPTKVLKGPGGAKAIREKSTVDYIGTWRGRPIAFDAKSTRRRRFDLDNVHAHQVEFLRQWVTAGGIGFLLIEYPTKEGPMVRLVPWEQLQWFWDRYQSGGRASISDLEMLELPLVRAGRAVALDYLQTLILTTLETALRRR